MSSKFIFFFGKVFKYDFSFDFICIQTTLILLNLCHKDQGGRGYYTGPQSFKTYFIIYSLEYFGDFQTETNISKKQINSSERVLLFMLIRSLYKLSSIILSLKILEKKYIFVFEHQKVFTVLLKKRCFCLIRSCL